MKKRVLSAIVAVLLLVISVTALTACGKLTEAEQKVVGKYRLIAIYLESYPDITVDSYEYYTLDFKDNKKCVITYKAKNDVYEATASWKINKEGFIEVITRSGLNKQTENYQRHATINAKIGQYTVTGIGILTGDNDFIIDGVSVTMKTAFEKISEG